MEWLSQTIHASLLGSHGFDGLSQAFGVSLTKKVGGIAIAILATLGLEAHFLQ
ncbi:hypothetical protein IMZ31_01650 [Pontibacillus sp. ALD_SL1]|uniref:hypothetical protein n=1 Tax=Pontibacillus sp. ALD_SL1 TaxID=2777185 RepID=UPI001A96BB2C|nr:hypothetical protein [Pontibacillus sp. ALD_SL1]QST00331.1 hypothetical protein IMZ31_01650 [Pontibacillus sp. ALD_SL1]